MKPSGAKSWVLRVQVGGRLGHKMLLTPAYRALTPNARALLVELAMMENGSNNAVKLSLSVRDAAHRMGIADLKAASAAFKELEALGFVVMTADAHFAVKAVSGAWRSLGRHSTGWPVTT